VVVKNSCGFGRGEENNEVEWGPWNVACDHRDFRTTHISHAAHLACYRAKLSQGHSEQGCSDRSARMLKNVDNEPLVDEGRIDIASMCEIRQDVVMLEEAMGENI
jgi:hypothetical protein